MFTKGFQQSNSSKKRERETEDQEARHSPKAVPNGLPQSFPEQYIPIKKNVLRSRFIKIRGRIHLAQHILLQQSRCKTTNWDKCKIKRKIETPNSLFWAIMRWGILREAEILRNSTFTLESFIIFLSFTATRLTHYF